MFNQGDVVWFRLDKGLDKGLSDIMHLGIFNEYFIKNNRCTDNYDCLVSNLFAFNKDGKIWLKDHKGYFRAIELIPCNDKFKKLFIP